MRRTAIVGFAILLFTASLSPVIAQNVTYGPTVTLAQPSGTYTVAGCTVAVTHGTCLAASLVKNHVMVQNVSATASVACAWGGTAALNDKGSVQLGPGMSALWGPPTAGVPSGLLDCISSLATTPLYVEYN